MGRRKDHTRIELETLIINSAWNILADEGPAALTARRIATVMGYTPGTIYNIFSSMDDVILHINSRTLDILYEYLASPECHRPDKPALYNLKKMAQFYLAFSFDYRPYWQLLFRQHDTIPSLPDWYTDKLQHIFIPLENILTPYFSSRQATKRRLTARTLWGAVHGLCFLEQNGTISRIAPDKRGPNFAPLKSLINNLIETYADHLSQQTKPIF